MCQAPLYTREIQAPEKLRNLPEVTQLGHSSFRLLTDQKGKSKGRRSRKLWGY